MPASPSQNSLPPSSLVIGSRNRPSLLLQCVKSILQGAAVPNEILIIDQSDGPDPILADFATDRSCDIRYRWVATRGVSRARNEGIAEARHEVLVFVDDDMLFPPHWFGSLVGTLKEGGWTVVTGAVLPCEGVDGGFAPSTKVDAEATVYEGRVGADVLYTGNSAFFRSTLREIGGFDERLGPGTSFPAAEDNDLCFRLLEAGHRIRYEPDAWAYHREWRSTGDIVRLQWKYGRGQGAYYAKHVSLRDRYMLKRMVRQMNYHSAHIGRNVRRRRRSAAIQEAVSILGLLAGAGHWWFSQLWRCP